MESGQVGRGRPEGACASAAQPAQPLLQIVLHPSPPTDIPSPATSACTPSRSSGPPAGSSGDGFGGGGALRCPDGALGGRREVVGHFETVLVGDLCIAGGEVKKGLR
jgi:hypothetical protein